MLQITEVYKSTGLGGIQHNLAELKILAVTSQQ